MVGFDIEHHVYGDARYPAQLVIQDVLTLHGAQFKDAALIVASPPCQAYSYRAMPWKRAKALPPPDNTPFEACFRIQREAIDAAGHHIPLVVENVCGAQKWVGRARAHFGSFYLWGDVPALMPIIRKHVKVPTMGAGWYPPDHPKHVPGLAFNGHADRNLREEGAKNPGFRFDGSGRSFHESVERHTKNDGGSWFAVAHNTTSGHGQNPDGRKTPTGVGDGSWFGSYAEQKARGTISVGRMHSSKSTARKAASAHIAKIPAPLARWIARAWYPSEVNCMRAMT